MRVYRGKKRIAKKIFSPLDGRPEVQELLDYLVRGGKGTLFHACTGFNHRVADMEFVWAGDGPRTKKLYDLIVLDESGRAHYLSGHGCIDLPIPRESVQAMVDHLGPDGLRHFGFPKLAERMERGEEVIDEDGCPILPAW